ncbi:hypothetical protein ACFP65_08505 [Marinilactibacillus sp. GCM10026970]|uniref:YrzE family protein n=1 Tax=Marinilactibacillus sp. GCM10026970 TaxID=3252642 RepID=UPI00361ABFF6
MKKRVRHYLGAGETEAGFNLSWGAVIAGVVTILALMLMLSFITSAIGLGVAEPTSSNPLDGVGTGVAIWTVIAFVLAFFGGGFIAGATSRRVGLVHGFLTWASSLIVLVIMLSYLASGIFSLAGSVLGTVTNAVGSAAETTIDLTGSAVSTGFESAAQGVENVDSDELQTQVDSVLQDTDIPELQPDYLQGQVSEATDEVAAAGQEIVTNPDNADSIISDLLDSLEERATTIGDAADEDAIANAVESNTDLSQEEADEATQNIVEAYENTTTQAQTTIENLRGEVENLQTQVDQTIQDARVQAEEATDAGSKYSIWAFIALLLSMILTSVAGLLGSNTVKMSKSESRV